MRKLIKFWAALESPAGLEAVRGQWQLLLEEEWARARCWLQPSEDLATCYPKLQEMPDSPFAYRVVCHDEVADDYVGVCPDGTGEIPLRRDDLTLYLLNLPKLAGSLSKALQITPDFELTGCCPRLYKVGSYNPPAAASAAIYLAVPSEPADLKRIVEHVLAHEPLRFLILTPTRKLWRTWPASMRHNRFSDIISLSDLILARDDGSLMAERSAADLYRAIESTAAPAPRADGFYPPNIVIWQAKKYECELSGKLSAIFCKTLAEVTTPADALMHRRRGAVWKRKFVSDKSKRDLISKQLSRLTAKLASAKPPVPLIYSLVKGEDIIRREDISVKKAGT